MRLKIVCDRCGNDFSTSEERGGLSLDGTVLCPSCAATAERSADGGIGRAVSHLACPEGTTFRDWVADMRTQGEARPIVAEFTSDLGADVELHRGTIARIVDGQAARPARCELDKRIAAAFRLGGLGLRSTLEGWTSVAHLRQAAAAAGDEVSLATLTACDEEMREILARHIAVNRLGILPGSAAVVLSGDGGTRLTVSPRSAGRRTIRIEASERQVPVGFESLKTTGTASRAAAIAASPAFQFAAPRKPSWRRWLGL